MAWKKIIPDQQTLRAVWDMYVHSYREIGLTIADPRDLADEYDVWDLYYLDGVPIAFKLSKTTPYGVKGGLSGTDGSREAKQIFREYIATWFNKPGNYSEVSHKMEHLAFKLGVPVVCAVFAAQVLNKPIEPLPDGIHYRRYLKQIGPVVKVMIGRPYGIEVTSSTDLYCPRPSASFGRRARLRIDSSLDAELDHLASFFIG